MPFPDAQRVIYNKNPLVKVVCQLRFPVILKIDVEIPAEFQNRIRVDFPVFSEKQAIKVDVSNSFKGKIPEELLQKLKAPSSSKNYEFVSEDGKWLVNLTRSFMSLTCLNYLRWEQFREKLSGLLNILIELYSPQYFTRIGLRYVDIIDRESLGLGGVSWIDLIKPQVLGMLGSKDIESQVDVFESKYEIDMLEGVDSKVRVLTSFAANNKTNELCYMIDSDFYKNSKTSLEDTLERLDFYNRQARNLMQWCITERLHKAMEPESV
jgi:uncharacterized protein (TIGR04255 family)